jgi:hypothetical protein
MPYEGVSTLFQSVMQNTQLTTAQIADASGKHQRVRRCLNSWYYSVDSSTANSFLVGSYVKDTQIKPPSDVDILFKLPDSVWRRFYERVGNKQSQLLQEVRSALLATFPTTAIKGDGQIVSVPFETYAIEVLPAFPANSTYLHADSNGGGSWRNTDPVAEHDYLTASNTTTGGKTKHLIKMLKAWKWSRGVPIKSFVLELAASRFLTTWSYNLNADGTPTSFGYYDYMLRDFFTWLQGVESQAWYLPGSTLGMVNLGNAWSAQARFAATASARATRLGAEDKPALAAMEWRNVLGNYVPPTP